MAQVWRNSFDESIFCRFFWDGTFLIVFSFTRSVGDNVPSAIRDSLSEKQKSQGRYFVGCRSPGCSRPKSVSRHIATCSRINSQQRETEKDDQRNRPAVVEKVALARHIHQSSSDKSLVQCRLRVKSRSMPIHQAQCSLISTRRCFRPSLWPHFHSCQTAEGLVVSFPQPTLTVASFPQQQVSPFRLGSCSYNSGSTSTI